MFFKQSENLLPKKQTDGVALKTSAFQHQLLKLKGFKKLNITSKFFIGALTVLYFLGYQPTLAVPPIKQAIVLAASTQEQAIATIILPQPFILPHPGYISTRFSAWHPGIDIATGLGMPIHPIADGKVIEVTWGFLGLGHSVIIEHAQGFRSIYGHMGKIYVEKGALVNQVSILGEVGLTGHTTGPHTHLELTKDGQYTDPEKLLPTIPGWPEQAGIAPQGQGDVIITPTPAPRKILPKELILDTRIINLKNIDQPMVKIKSNLLSNYFTL